MVVVSFRASTVKVAAVLCALGVIIAAAFWEGGVARSAVSGAYPAAAGVTLGGGIDFSKNENRVAFLKSLGWQVSGTPVEVVEIVIPQAFDPVYNNYNTIQKAQGFDLARYRGVRAKRWTYSVSNYPGDKTSVRANLLVYDGMLIGGDVSSVSANGFMQGLRVGNVQTGIKASQADIVAETLGAAH